MHSLQGRSLSTELSPSRVTPGTVSPGVLLGFTPLISVGFPFVTIVDQITLSSLSIYKRCGFPDPYPSYGLRVHEAVHSLLTGDHGLQVEAPV